MIAVLVATTEGVAGQRVKQTLGLCFGVVVRSRGLGGIIMMRFNSAEIGQSMSEIVAYGTAVLLEPLGG